VRRYVIYGAGAIGGAIGGQLLQAGAEVTFIARGANYNALLRGGLRIETPTADQVFQVHVINHPTETTIGPDDVVVLAMKTQDTSQALHDLAAAAPHDVSILCAQNGVENERLALRQFAHVYGGFIFIASAHLQPGTIAIHTAPSVGVVDIGAIPHGVDAISIDMADDLRRAGFDAVARPNIMAWKREKLLLNLVNACQAICGSSIEDVADLGQIARLEGEACLRAADLPYIASEEAAERIAALLPFRRVKGLPFPGGSSWQSLQRGSPMNEVQYLSGEIVLLGRLHGIPTPVNTYLHEVVGHMARSQIKPGFVPLDDLRAQIRDASKQSMRVDPRSDERPQHV
jgi:2-dehydropantoate 2-reductase